MHCPLKQFNPCIERQCAWWDDGNKCCAVLGLLVERIKATEAVLDSAPTGAKSETKVVVNPVVQVKEVIKHIPIPMEKPDGTTQSSGTSEDAPKVSW